MIKYHTRRRIGQVEWDGGVGEVEAASLMRARIGEEEKRIRPERQI